MTEVQLLEVSVDEDKVRLDRWVANRFPSLGYRSVQKLLRTGQVRVDGARAVGSFRLTVGQKIRVPPITEPIGRTNRVKAELKDAELENLRSRILYEDDQLLVLDKPPGLAVQGGTGQSRHLAELAKFLVASDIPAPKLVHRLDKDTSGVLVMAKTMAAARTFGKLFKSGKIRKTYWAVVVGIPFPLSGVMDNILDKRMGPGGEKVTVTSDEGKPARTRYHTLDRKGTKAALVALYPETGRTHQLRVHCAELGTPILGDGKYGGPNSFIKDLSSARRLHLHARAIEFPTDDIKKLRVVAPLPYHMRESMVKLALNPGE